MPGMLFLMFVQSLFPFGAKEGIWEGYYGDKNYIDMFFLKRLMVEKRLFMIELSDKVVRGFNNCSLK